MTPDDKMLTTLLNAHDISEIYFSKVQMDIIKLRNSIIKDKNPILDELNKELSSDNKRL